jgi:valyl-tRNA synthetase
MFGGILGKDLYFDEMEIEKGRKLTTKIFNAGRLVLMKLKDFSPKEIKNKNIKLEEFDKWILQKSFKTVREMAKALEKYQYFKARKIFEDFFWSEFCDNYLEIAKGRLSINSNDKKDLSKKISAQYATYYSFLNILKMAAPFVPYITEEIYHSELKDKNSDNIILISEKNKGYFYKNEKIKSIHKTLWPLNNNIKIENSVIKKAKTALMIISQIRKIKSTHNIKLGENISVLKIKCPLDKQRDIKPFLDDIAYIAKAEKIEMEEGENIEVSI